MEPYANPNRISTREAVELIRRHDPSSPISVRGLGDRMRRRTVQSWIGPGRRRYTSLTSLLVAGLISPETYEELQPADVPDYLPAEWDPDAGIADVAPTNATEANDTDDPAQTNGDVPSIGALEALLAEPSEAPGDARHPDCASLSQSAAAGAAAGTSPGSLPDAVAATPRSWPPRALLPVGAAVFVALVMVVGMLFAPERTEDRIPDHQLREALASLETRFGPGLAEAAAGKQRRSSTEQAARRARGKRRPSAGGERAAPGPSNSPAPITSGAATSRTATPTTGAVTSDTSAPAPSVGSRVSTASVGKPTASRPSCDFPPC